MTMHALKHITDGQEEIAYCFFTFIPGNDLLNNKQEVTLIELLTTNNSKAGVAPPSAILFQATIFAS